MSEMIDKYVEERYNALMDGEEVDDLFAGVPAYMRDAMLYIDPRGKTDSQLRQAFPTKDLDGESATNLGYNIPELDRLAALPDYDTMDDVHAVSNTEEGDNIVEVVDPTYKATTSMWDGVFGRLGYLERKAMRGIRVVLGCQDPGEQDRVVCIEWPKTRRYTSYMDALEASIDKVRPSWEAYEHIIRKLSLGKGNVGEILRKFVWYYSIDVSLNRDALRYLVYFMDLLKESRSLLHECGERELAGDPIPEHPLLKDEDDEDDDALRVPIVDVQVGEFVTETTHLPDRWQSMNWYDRIPRGPSRTMWSDVRIKSTQSDQDALKACVEHINSLDWKTMGRRAVRDRCRFMVHLLASNGVSRNVHHDVIAMIAVKVHREGMDTLRLWAYLTSIGGEWHKDFSGMVPLSSAAHLDWDTGRKVRHQVHTDLANGYLLKAKLTPAMRKWARDKRVSVQFRDIGTYNETHLAGVFNGKDWYVRVYESDGHRLMPKEWQEVAKKRLARLLKRCESMLDQRTNQWERSREYISMRMAKAERLLAS